MTRPDHPRLTRVLAPAMTKARPYGGNPEAWALIAAAHVIECMDAAIADRLEAALDVCRECGNWSGHPKHEKPEDPEDEGWVHPYVPLVEVPHD